MPSWWKIAIEGVAMRLWVSLISGCLAVVLIPHPALPQNPETATVRILIVDGTGRELGKAQVSSFTSKRTGQDLGARFYDNTATGIPYDRYQLDVHATGFVNARRVVQVFSPVVWVIATLEFSVEGREFAPPRTLSGKLTNVSRGEQPIFLRLMGIYSDLSIEARPDASTGSFSFAGVISDGKYILLTIGRTGVLDSRQIDFPNSDEIVIRLTNRKRRSAGLGPH
jgi:hypothetical protein